MDAHPLSYMKLGKLGTAGSVQGREGQRQLRVDFPHLQRGEGNGPSEEGDSFHKDFRLNIDTAGHAHLTASQRKEQASNIP